jgi:glutaminyl-peptide cyclotransferase
MQGLLGNFNTGRTDVFNGIAYHPGEELFYVTGKWWPRTFKVVFE